MILVEIVISLARFLPFQCLFWAWKYPAVVPSHSGANWTALTTRIRPAYQPSQVGSLCPHLKLYLSNDEASIVTTPRLPPLQILMTMRLPSPSKHPQTNCGTKNQPLDSYRNFNGFNYPSSRLTFKSKPQSLLKYFTPKITIEIAATDLPAAKY